MEKDTTRELIIKTAKQLFREYGYHAMRVSDISKKLKISKGNLTYYFPTKASLVQHLFASYYDTITKYLDNACLPIEHFYSRELYSSMIADINIMSDPQIRAFYFDLINEPVQCDVVRSICLRQIRSLCDNNCVVAAADELLYYSESMMGAYNAIDQMFIATGEPTEEQIYNHVTLKQMVRAQLWVVQKSDGNIQETKESIKRHVDILRRQDFSHIHLL